MTWPAHRTPAYFVSRVRRSLYERQHPDQPWLVQEAVDLLASLLRPTDVVLEWGSGRSTAWLAGRVGRLVSVEDSEIWAEKVRVILEEKGLPVDYRVHTGQDYIDVANGFEDESLDVCLIDGSRRDACARAAISKIKRGGLLVVDDVQRYLGHSSIRAPNVLSADQADPAWADVAATLRSWRAVWFSDGVSATAIFLRT
jgi:predicted O-methyltransferase YrrM